MKVRIKILTGLSYIEYYSYLFVQFAIEKNISIWFWMEKAFWPSFWAYDSQ